jgi:hypothetical protein
MQPVFYTTLFFERCRMFAARLLKRLLKGALWQLDAFDAKLDAS